MSNTGGIKIVLNKQGVRELLQSQDIRTVCQSQANNILSRLGNGYKVVTKTGFDRVHSYVMPDTYEAYKENLRENSILKAVGGMR